ncbi:PREDICTED: RING-H2 finger protein ATL43 [Tarenaya hassleriana]|uniref:RING-H2 finger protein ATL43 n=1 Tax=Tarenaya hassleriana TaxID=28532 RepID=UPI00053C2B22|nr:PREDICTED: RING-H2 finger protein ATL43 [Tarenaya hassleriana]
MSNTRNRYSAFPETRFSGWQLPAFYPRNSFSRTDPIGNRRLEPWGAYSGPFSSTIDPGPSNPPRQIPIRANNGLQSERPRPAIIPRPVRPWASASFSEDDVLKNLTKETYNPAPKSQLLRNLSLYYRNQNRGGGGRQSFADTTMDSDNEDGKRCTVCLEDFEPKETVMITPCKHMFHEDCIVPWLKSKGQCPVCRSVVCEGKKETEAPPVGDMTVDDLFNLELLSVVRTLEESFGFGFPRHL